MHSPGRALLDELYERFGERSDDLLGAASHPEALVKSGGPIERWTDLGDWLGLAERLGAEKVLFVRGDPVAVFADARTAPDESSLGELYRRAWCMAEPRRLFIALPDEVRIYDLNLPPKRGAPPSDPWRVLSTAADVLELTREVDEFGSGLEGLMHVGDTASAPARADRRLIGDLRILRSQLEGTGLTMAEAHALIGRSILVRYLEDRGVLTRAYFEHVAGDSAIWRRILEAEGDTPVLGPPGKQRFYDRVLRDADFTSALFDRLAKDFNGDLFALGQARGKRFSESALLLLRAFLLGEVESDQQPLFFWAYDFEVVPLALISSIYEQFYHDALNQDAADRDRSSHDARRPKGVPGRRGRSVRHAGGPEEGCDEPQEGTGTHYTPANLVHDVLRRTLTPARLALEPKILDPACGSGIFLVEAFRRVVRYEAQRLRRRLVSTELRGILQRRVFGIEINAEAARVAAFSLYLALLDQQEPPDIASGDPLPYLLHSGLRDEDHFGILVVSDAFAPTGEERQVLSDRVSAKPSYAGRAGDLKLLSGSNPLDLPLGGFDVVVGNPPWQEAAGETSLPRLWAAAFKLPTGEGSLSQLFIHRAMTLLREGGAFGLLVGMKVFWNDRDTSRLFREHLLAHAALGQVVNMTHVRRAFFAKAVAPFAFVLAEKRPSRPEERVVFWNARRTGSVERLRTMSAVPLERRVVVQAELASADYLWKVFWWGGHHDAALVSRLRLERTLEEAIGDSDPQPQYGWQRGGREPSGRLAVLPELSNRKVQPFGPLQDDWFLPPPKGIKRDPDQRIYEGRRLVITHGVREPLGPVARLEDRAFSFRHSFYCIPLRHVPDAHAKLALGVLWSSLGRYLLFMTAGSWGGWHDKVTARDLLGIPVRFAPSWGMGRREHENAATRIERAVDLLRSRLPAAPRNLDLFDEQADQFGNDRENALRTLNDAVFDLFELSPAERDLVRDFWAEEHDLYWRGAASTAIKRVPVFSEVVGSGTALLDGPMPDELWGYLRAFLGAWEEQLPEAFDLSWRIVPSPARDALAAVFDLVDSGGSDVIAPDGDWASIVARCADALSNPVSPAFHVRRFVRAVAGNGFIVLKDNARRLWTASAARQDAEALFVQLASRRAG
ncbi:Eco57I restriction-modification methylase domain-containing protein [Sphingomonas sp. CFBP 8760]|uniref:Eco57I restriction-modification methylase domain-containing protein n=1 Tax=Sphingomonas sp. CFBP 8760 TaxID=2775282 RepID=UPI00177DB470|nr:N-6 DNA methylase [Sphingomonas sp. CFBP 8760]MBD8548663.1 N-6 DNA methylase [Sphingomonas sp. CFBP 8760]